MEPGRGWTARIATTRWGIPSRRLQRQAVDRAIAELKVSRDLPFVRREGIRLLKEVVSKSGCRRTGHRSGLAEFLSVAERGQSANAGAGRRGFSGTLPPQRVSTIARTEAPIRTTPPSPHMPGCFPLSRRFARRKDGTSITATARILPQQTDRSGRNRRRQTLVFKRYEGGGQIRRIFNPRAARNAEDERRVATPRPRRRTWESRGALASPAWRPCSGGLDAFPGSTRQRVCRRRHESRHAPGFVLLMRFPQAPRAHRPTSIPASKRGPIDSTSPACNDPVG